MQKWKSLGCVFTVLHICMYGAMLLSAPIYMVLNSMKIGLPYYFIFGGLLPEIFVYIACGIIVGWFYGISGCKYILLSILAHIFILCGVLYLLGNGYTKFQKFALSDGMAIICFSWISVVSCFVYSKNRVIGGGSQ